MRIIHEYTQGSIKVTIFRFDNKFSVKLESDLMEQTYKFRDGDGIESLNDVMGFLTDTFFKSADEIFSEMSQLRHEALASLGHRADDDEFPVIL